jgi:hypothetical protein
MGGMAAEARYTGRRNYRAAGSDIHQSIRLASYLYGDKILGKYIEFMIAMAEEFFQSAIQWVRVEALAADLLEKGTLKSREAREVCLLASRDRGRFEQLCQERHAREESGRGHS